MTVRSTLQQTADAILNPLGARIVRKDATVVDTRQLLSYASPNGTRALYDEAIRRAGVEPTDNFFKRCRFDSLIDNLRETANLSGDVAECGCARGHSTYMIAKT